MGWPEPVTGIWWRGTALAAQLQQGPSHRLTMFVQSLLPRKQLQHIMIISTIAPGHPPIITSLSLLLVCPYVRANSLIIFFVVAVHPHVWWLNFWWCYKCQISHGSRVSPDFCWSSPRASLGVGCIEVLDELKALSPLHVLRNCDIHCHCQTWLCMYILTYVHMHTCVCVALWHIHIYKYVHIYMCNKKH